MKLYSCVEEREVYNGRIIIKSYVYENDPLFVMQFAYRKDGSLKGFRALYDTEEIFYYSNDLIRDHINEIYTYG